MRSANLTNSRFFSLLWLLLLASLTTTASAQIRPADVDDLLGLSGSQLIELDIPDELGGYLEVAVPIEGKLEILELIPRSVRAADFLIQSTDDNGKTIFTDPGPVRTFRGVVNDMLGSDVAGALHIEGLWAHIVLPDGSSYWIEPLAERFPGFRREDHVVYQGDQVLPSDGFCGVTGTAQGSPLPGMVGGTGCNGDFCIADIACDTDFEFFTTNFSSNVRTTNRVELLTNIVNQQFERDVQISHRIVTVNVRSTQGMDPYPAACPPPPPPVPCTTGTAFVTAVQNEWLTNPNLTTINRDFVHLFTGDFGFIPPQGTIGEVFAIGSVCNINTHYSWSTDTWGGPQPGCSQSLAGCTDLIAHEWGHLWNANHCLQQDIDGDGVFDNVGCSNPAFTMNANILGSNRFRSATQTFIENFRDSLGNCLDSGVNNDNCSDALPVCSGTYIGTTVGAIQDGSTDCGTNADLDVWYRFTPEADGNVTFTVFELTGGLPFVLSVHRGCPGSSSNEIDCDLDSTAEVTVPVTAGVTILIRIAVTNGSVAGNFFLNVDGTDCAPPINDDCASPINICPGEYIGTTEGATAGDYGDCEVGFRVPNAPISDTLPPTTDSVTLSAGITVTDVDVSMVISHTWIGDLAVDISSPGGTTVRLHNNQGGSANNISLVYDDAGIPNGPPFNTGVRMQPSGPGVLADFNGQAADGAWVLSITDNAASDNGQLVSWGVFLTGIGDPANATPDVWYRYTPAGTAANELMVIDTCDSDFDTAIELYDAVPPTTGACPGNVLACIDNNVCGTGDSIAWPVNPGDSFLIRVSGAAGASGAFRLGLSGPQCANDICTTATVIDSGTHFGTLDGASNDGTPGGGGASLCGASMNVPDVYYSFTVPYNGIFFANTCGTHDLFGQDSGVNTVLSIHSGCPADSTNLLQCSDDWFPLNFIPCDELDLGIRGDSSVIDGTVQAGDTIIVRVSQNGSALPWDIDDPGPFVLNIGVIPENDDCEDLAGNPVAAIDVSDGGSYTGDSTFSSSVGSSSCDSTGPDLWYQYTASCNGTLLVDTCGTHDLNGQAPNSGIDTVLSLHSSCPGTEGNQLVCNDDWVNSTSPAICTGLDVSPNRDSFVSLAMIQGTTVFIRVGTFGATPPGPFNLNVGFVEAIAPPHSLRNGDFSSAGDHWCFIKPGISGSREFPTVPPFGILAQVTGADAGEVNNFTRLEQTFTTFDTQSHRISFDFTWFPAGMNDDSPLWDLIDVATSLSVVGGPITLSTSNTQVSGSEDISFSGSGSYLLQIGTFTTTGVFGAGGTAFDNIEISCDNTPGPLANGDFSDPSGDPWCFTDNSDDGSVNFSGGQAVVTGGDDGISGSSTSYISQNIDLPIDELQLSFSWSFATADNGSDFAYYQLLDPNGNAVNTDTFLSSTNGASGLEVLVFNSVGGTYVLKLGTLSPNNLGGPGISAFGDVVIQSSTCEPVTGLGCTESPVAVQLEWTNNDNYSEIQIYSDLSGLIATIDGDQTSFFDNFPPQGTSTYWVEGVCGLIPAPPSNTCTVTGTCPRVEPLTCNVYGSQVFLVWNNPANYTTIQIRLGTLVIATLIGNKNQYLFDAPGPGTYTLCVVGFCGGVEADATCCEVTIGSTEQEFIRGDCNIDNSVDIGDVISLLGFLFLGDPIGSCADAYDINDDGALDIGDAIFLLGHLFINGSPPPVPFPGCGPDLTPDTLDCISYPFCP